MTEKMTEKTKDNLDRDLARRFYSEVTVSETAGVFAVLLDGRRIKTPMRGDLALPAQPLAEAIASEWAAQKDHIRPDEMPLTRLANTAIDRIGAEGVDIAGELLRFAGADLVCYRADNPEGLVDLQEKHWRPVLDWAANELGARFVVTTGLVHQLQPESALARLGQHIAEMSPHQLVALHSLTVLSGSVLIACALAAGRLSGKEAWQAAEVDETWQVSQWGDDREAAIARENRKTAFFTALRYLELLGGK